MANTSKMVQINSKYLRDEFEMMMLVPTEVAREIGYHPAYISKTLSRGRCNRDFVMKLKEKYGILPSDYVSTEDLWKIDGEGWAVATPKETAGEFYMKGDDFLRLIADTVYEAVKKALKEGEEEIDS